MALSVYSVGVVREERGIPYLYTYSGHIIYTPFVKLIDLIGQIFDSLIFRAPAKSGDFAGLLRH